MSDLIQIAYGETQMALENEVMKAVCKVGINVNKEELLKALELSESLVRCAECKYHNGEYCFRLVSKDAWDLIGSQCVITMQPDDFCSYGCRKESE